MPAAKSQKLKRLLDELDAVRAAEPTRRNHYRGVIQNVEKALPKIPLVHGISKCDDLPHVVAQGELLARSTRTKGKKILRSEQRLNIPPSVYTAAGILYPKRVIALVFRYTVETEENMDANASPWDSGYFCKTQHGTLKDAREDKRYEIFWSYTLPAPEYRDYLVHYVASCFGSVTDYLGNRPHCYADPLGVLDPTCRSSGVFEVRFRDRLLVGGSRLLAVFVPRHVARLHDTLRTLRGQRVAVEYYNGTSETLHSRVQQWMNDHFNDHFTSRLRRP